MSEDAIWRSEISISHRNSVISLFQAGDRSNNVLLWKMLRQLIWKVAPQCSIDHKTIFFWQATSICLQSPSKCTLGYCSVQKKNGEWSCHKYFTFIYLLVSYELQLSNYASLFPSQVVVQEKHTLFIAQVCATDLHNFQF